MNEEYIDPSRSLVYTFYKKATLYTEFTCVGLASLQSPLYCVSMSIHCDNVTPDSIDTMQVDDAGYQVHDVPKKKFVLLL